MATGVGPFVSRRTFEAVTGPKREWWTWSLLKAGDGRPLDPRTEPARVRARFVRDDWTRRGLGRAILGSCERAADAAGFNMLALMATLPGVPLYRALGFREQEQSGSPCLTESRSTAWPWIARSRGQLNPTPDPTEVAIVGPEPFRFHSAFGTRRDRLRCRRSRLAAASPGRPFTAVKALERPSKPAICGVFESRRPDSDRRPLHYEDVSRPHRIFALH